MLNLSVTTFFADLHAWLLNHVLSLNSLIELGMLAAAFVLAVLVNPLLYKRATHAIESAALPLKTKRVAKNSRRLILPAVLLAAIYIQTVCVTALNIPLDISALSAIIKVLMAWIAIQLLLYFVENVFIRNIFFWTIWIAAALSIFGVLEQTIIAMDAASFTLGSMRLSLLEIVKSALLLILLLYASLFVSAFFERKVLKSKNFSRSSQVLLVKIIRIALIVSAVIIGITSAGIDLSVFAVFSGAIGLGIGLGLQRTVSNLFSGFLLLMDQSIKPGDVIELEASGTFGTVNKMAARYTEVVTRTNKSYLIPNEDFITQRMINWSHSDNLVRLDVAFGVHYNSDPHTVIKLVLDSIREIPRIKDDPVPECFLTAFGDSSLNFMLQFWIVDAEHGVNNIKGEALLKIWDVFEANGIEIPYPHRVIHQGAPMLEEN
jgi:small-conductance mechanosensitive channel